MGTSKSNKPKFDSNFIELWRNGGGSKIVQPNVITRSSFKYSTLQMRVFIRLMSMLQNSLGEYYNYNKNGKGVDVMQLSLFSANTKDFITLSLPFKGFGMSANRYDEIRTAAELMCSIPIQLPDETNEKGELKHTWASLITQVAYTKGSRTFEVEIKKNVAEYLHRILPENGGYTRYIQEVAMSLGSAYSIKLYMFLSMMKGRGGVTIGMKKFRNLLSIEQKYERYSNLRNQILEPCREIFKTSCDFWFEFSEVYEEGKSTGEPKDLVFKIISYRNPEQTRYLYKSELPKLLYTMREFLRIEEHNVQKLLPYISPDNFEQLQLKLEDLCIVKNTYSRMSKIDNKPAYFFESIRKIVAPESLTLKWTRN